MGSAVTACLLEWNRGEEGALERLFPLVLGDLKRAAAFYFEREDAGHTLQPTAVVNELYLRMQRQRKVHWENRAQFFAYAGKLVRRLLTDYARGRKALKRGAGTEKVPLTGAMSSACRQDLSIDTILDLDRALERLEGASPRLAQIVELRFFADLKVLEIAEMLEVSEATVKRDWATAKRILARDLQGGF